MNSMDYMCDLRYELIDILRDIEILTCDIYSSLVLKYGKYLVNSVIESMDDYDNLLKYESYITMRTEELYSKTVDSFDLYMQDIRRLKKFNYKDNKKYTIELNSVFKKIDSIFYEFGFSEKLIKLSLNDKVCYFLNNCNDVDSIKKLNELYIEYINIRNKIILGNLYLVISIANSYCKNSDVDLELIQSGNEGLIKAIEKYNPYMDAAFSTYAYYWIKNNIICSMRHNYTCLTIPSGIQTFSQKVISARKKLEENLKREPTDLEIAEYLNSSLSKIYEATDAYNEIISLSSMLEQEMLTGECEFLMEEDYMSDKLDNVEIMKIIKDCLTNNEFLVLSMRYGLEDDIIYTYRSIGSSLNMSTENARLTHNRALKKIREKFCNNIKK